MPGPRRRRAVTRSGPFKPLVRLDRTQVQKRASMRRPDAKRSTAVVRAEKSVAGHNRQAVPLRRSNPTPAAGRMQASRQRTIKDVPGGGKGVSLRRPGERKRASSGRTRAN